MSNRFNRLKATLAVLAVIWFMQCKASAQTTSGDLVGRVSDSSGASISDAHLTAVNTATNVSNTVEVNASGDFHFVNLPVGNYDVTATAAGFAAKQIKNFLVQLNQTSTLSISLSPANIIQKVEVQDSVAALDTTTAQLQTTYQPHELNAIPNTSVGSGILNASMLNAGVTLGGNSGEGSGPSVGGQRVINNGFSIEGVDDNQKQDAGIAVSVPSDAIANFTVLQNVYSAEFGHSSAGQFNQVILTGTDQIHGRAYEYFQNRNLNALDEVFKLQGATTAPRYDNNRFGGQVGGPILKDHLFYFVNFQYNPIGQAIAPASGVLSPTTAGYAALGAMAGLSATNLAILQQYLPAARSSTGTITVLNTPIPVGLTPGNINNSFINNTTLTTAADYYLSTRDSLHSRYIYYKQEAIDTAVSLPEFFTPLPTRGHLFSLSENHVFSPSIVNELRLAYNRYTQIVSPGNFRFPGLDSFPNINLLDLNVQLGPDFQAPNGFWQNTYQLVESLSWQKGNHSLKFGIEGRRYIEPEVYVLQARGDYEYSQAQFFLQDLSPDSVGQRGVGFPKFYGNNAAIYWYANDNWRITPKITVNLGVRYEYTTVAETLRLQKLNQIADAPGLLTFGEPRAPKNDYMPRIGIAYAPDSKTSIRAGYGINYDQYVDNIGFSALPPELSITESVPSLSNQTPNFLANGGLPPASGQIQVFPTAAAARAVTTHVEPVNLKYPYTENWTVGVQRLFGSDYVLEVRYVGNRGVHLDFDNAGINVMAPVTASNHLPTYMTPQPQSVYNSLPLTLAQLQAEPTILPAYANAGFTAPIKSYIPAGFSNYHGLQVQMNKRLSHQLQFQAAWTYSKAMDNSTDDFLNTVLTPKVPQDFQNLRAEYSISDFSRKHRVSLYLVYDVPWFIHSSNWFAKNIAGNFTISPVYTFESPQYADVQSGVDSNLNGNSLGDRAIVNPAGTPGVGTDVVPVTNGTACPDPTVTVCPQNTVAYVANNSNAYYVRAQPGAYANASRNTITLPHINNFDLAVIKNLSITERFKLQFFVQLYNAFNHYQFIPGAINDVASIQSVTTGDQNFLTPGSPSFNNPNLSFSSNPRTVQLGLKILF
jgi:hypothetical protein